MRWRVWEVGAFQKAGSTPVGLMAVEWEAWVPEPKHLSSSPGPEVSPVLGIRKLLPAYVLQGRCPILPDDLEQ